MKIIILLLKVGKMKFSELDRKMRTFEELNDQSVLPGVFVVVRLDGRNFTRLTKELVKFESPYDVVFRDYMIEVVKHLMECGFRVIYGYNQSDEISLLFHPLENTFQRKVRKINSILAGEASGKFSLLINRVVSFDSRICQFTSLETVVDYFRWRNEDSNRNALNSHCYWMLRKNGESERKAAKVLERLSEAEKNELLFQYGINFNDLPKWQKRGVGLYWQRQAKKGYNPKLNREEISEKKILKVDLELLMKEKYSQFIEKLFTDAIKKD
jgi:tRNA(His) 5'-end guanylyltransferase